MIYFKDIYETFFYSVRDILDAVDEDKDGDEKIRRAFAFIRGASEQSLAIVSVYHEGEEDERTDTND